MTWNGTHALKRAVAFLLAKQLPGGGWGESYLSCQDKEYTQLEGGEAHCVNTAWAMLALLASGQARRRLGGAALMGGAAAEPARRVLRARVALCVSSLLTPRSLRRQAERDAAPLHAAAAVLLRAQLPNGDWPQQHISGVFNRNCMITYANYRNIFPIWALGEYRRRCFPPAPESGR